MEAYEMHAAILTWKRCASVTYGGKPYFFVAFANPNNHATPDKYTVVWDRFEESWTVTKNDVHITNVSSPAKGKAYCERMVGNQA